jgi:solute:Na+ symporter, SSS family
MIHSIEYVVIAIYLVFMIIIGFVFKKLNSNVDDYFRSGCKGSWWLVGASNYISAISAYSFTGAAGVAYTAGWSVLIIYVYGPLTGFITYFFFAARFRQLRITTAPEAYKERFNTTTQQVYAIIAMVYGVLGVGLCLYSLSIFVSAVFDFSIVAIIIILSVVVIFYSLIGGKWGVMATDFLQSLILLSVAILVTVLCLYKLGGLSNLFELVRAQGLTEDFKVFNAPGRFKGLYTTNWAFAGLFWHVMTFNSLNTASRYFSVKDGKEAKKSVLLMMILGVLGAIFFFIPPITARLLYSVDVSALGLKNPAEASYAVVCMKLLPPGMIGLVIVAMFAAAMSTMDTGLNGGAANFVKNIYPVLAKWFSWRKRNPHEMLRLSQLFCLILGIVGTLVAIQYALSGNSQYGIVLTIGALLGTPLAVPMFWSLIIKKNTSGSGLFSVICGFLVSLASYISSAVYNTPWDYSTKVFSIMTVSSLAFFALIPFAKYNTDEYNQRVKGFFKRMNTPVDFAEEIGESNDSVQLTIIGSLAVTGGFLISLLAVMATSWIGIIAPLSVGGTITIVGTFMILAAKFVKNPEKNEEI